jgi:hypothetical protein
MNYFNTSITMLDRVSVDQTNIQMTLQGIKEGSEVVNTRLKNKAAEIQKKKDYIVVQTPVQWAQSLSYVFIEVRYAHRHDAPGCTRIEDENIEIEQREIRLSLLCIEANSKVKYHLKLTLWDQIDVNESRHEYQAVGKHHFTLRKAN